MKTSLQSATNKAPKAPPSVNKTAYPQRATKVPLTVKTTTGVATTSRFATSTSTAIGQPPASSTLDRLSSASGYSKPYSEAALPKSIRRSESAASSNLSIVNDKRRGSSISAGTTTGRPQSAPFAGSGDILTSTVGETPTTSYSPVAGTESEIASSSRSSTKTVVASNSQKSLARTSTPSYNSITSSTVARKMRSGSSSATTSSPTASISSRTGEVKKALPGKKGPSASPSSASNIKQAPTASRISPISSTGTTASRRASVTEAPSAMLTARSTGVSRNRRPSAPYSVDLPSSSSKIKPTSNPTAPEALVSPLVGTQACKETKDALPESMVEETTKSFTDGLSGKGIPDIDQDPAQYKSGNSIEDNMSPRSTTAVTTSLFPEANINPLSSGNLISPNVLLGQTTDVTRGDHFPFLQERASHWSPGHQMPNSTPVVENQIFMNSDHPSLHDSNPSGKMSPLVIHSTTVNPEMVSENGSRSNSVCLIEKQHNNQMVGTNLGVQSLSEVNVSPRPANGFTASTKEVSAQIRTRTSHNGMLNDETPVLLKFALEFQVKTSSPRTPDCKASGISPVSAEPLGVLASAENSAVRDMNLDTSFLLDRTISTKLLTSADDESPQVHTKLDQLEVRQSLRQRFHAPRTSKIASTSVTRIAHKLESSTSINDDIAPPQPQSLADGILKRPSIAIHGEFKANLVAGGNSHRAPKKPEPRIISLPSCDSLQPIIWSDEISPTLLEGKALHRLQNHPMSEMSLGPIGATTSPTVTIESGAIVCTTAILMGNHPISIGRNTIVQPGAMIRAEKGPIDIGVGNIFEELVLIQNRQDTGI